MSDTGRKPPKQPQSIHEWTVHVLNIEGILFEKWVEDVTLRAPRPWEMLTTQYPVEFPPAHGPNRGYESVLDVWAELRMGADWISLAIEAKKNDPRFVDWVFMPAETRRLKPLLTCIDANKTPIDSEKRPLAVVKALEIPGLIVTDACRETRGTWESKDKRDATKTSAKSIGDAAHQVAIAVQAIVQDEMSLWVSEIRERRSFPRWGWKTFIPVIVTTANLRILEFDPADVEVGSGTIDHTKTELRDVDWLIYLYPIPRHLQFGVTHPLTIVEGDLFEMTTRMPIIVVKASRFAAFLDDLIKQHDQFVGPTLPARDDKSKGPPT